MPGDAQDDLARVRAVLARELETINEYEAAARAAASPEVRAFLLHLAEEEKEHVAEATALVRRLDAGQERFFAVERGPEHFAAGAAAPETPPPHVPHREGTVPAVPDALLPPDTLPAWTVGPLKPRRAP